MIVAPTEFRAWSKRVAELHRDAGRVLEGLDELGLNQAGGHLSMAMDAMMQARLEQAGDG